MPIIIIISHRKVLTVKTVQEYWSCQNVRGPQGILSRATCSFSLN